MKKSCQLYATVILIQGKDKGLTPHADEGRYTHRDTKFSLINRECMCVSCV